MSRPKTAASLRPSTSAGQLSRSYRPTTTGVTRCEEGEETYIEQLESFDSGKYNDTEDVAREGHHHHVEEEDDDNVFAFAPPGLEVPGLQVVTAPTNVTAASPGAKRVEEPQASGGRHILGENLYYYDQESGAVYDAQGNLIEEPGPLRPCNPQPAGSKTRSSSQSGENAGKASQTPQRSTSIKWHPSTRAESGIEPRRCISSGKESEAPCSPTYPWSDTVSWSGHAGTMAPTSDSMDLIRGLPRPSFSRAVELELEEDDDSPYPEVRASVSNLDDPTMPSITFRSVLLGAGMSAFASVVNTFLSQRNPPIQILAIIIQILAHPLGTLLANILPVRSFQLRVPSLSKPRGANRPSKSYTWSFNPGPWNIKEHTVVLIAATTGLNPSYSLSILLAQDLPLFWDDRRTFLYGFLSVCAPQLIGLAMAGLVREVLVDPASMIWPQNLAVSTVLNTLHADEDAATGGSKGRMSRLRFFHFASALAFIFYFFPGYIFTALSVFNWVCWIWPDNVPVNVVFGAASGLGASVLTFDWTQIVYLGSPLITPWWAQANLFGGFVVGIWLAAPILYFTNALYTSYLPILSGSSFDRFGQKYNVTIVSPDHITLRTDAYDDYSQVYISAGLVVAYFGGFALITAAVVHTALYHGRFIWDRLRSRRTMPDDVHARLMRRYAAVPLLWYFITLNIGLLSAIFLAAAYRTGLPIWALCLAILIPVAYMLPFGFIFAMSGLPAGVNLVSELLASWLLPGKPLPVMLFKTVSQQTTTFGLLFAQDLKLGHYMKIAPRSIFWVQLLSIVVNSIIQILAKNYLRDHVQGLCDENQPQRFTCPTVNIFYTASVIWGAIGVERSFGRRSPYHSLFYGLVVGAALPIITWYASRKLGWTKMRFVSAPIIFVGMSLAPPASGINFTSAIVVGYFFQYWMRKNRREWWSRYNFVLAGALDFGTIMSSIAIYFLLQVPKNGDLELEWWGNQVFLETADVLGTPLAVAPDNGFAPPPGTS
ncbi:related to oligopeptide transporter [Melanopsichium pennsylvanicum]|uniref:Related to oligopeptide transporter n=2 Tax=Melanopsichium pennsylvanicum TaxID=63383 RepID=A0AAJ4XGN3_9BASI|nr:related to oligopeptide transporter [Melanopsichium pennsylvanicum 4]SNX82054.1 related to oligopeptide transporter [Melanopsichium pennsylvanicum]